MIRPIVVVGTWLVLVPQLVASQDPDSLPGSGSGNAEYRVYTGHGVASSLEEILAAAQWTDVLLIGEEHDDMVGHRIEEAILERLITGGGETQTEARSVILSLEMFERDVQYVLDEYLEGLITEDHFLDSSRPWDDYHDRYRGVVELAKESGVRIIAANAPRRYVNRVTREGPESLDVLSPQARALLPPLPYPGPSDAYRAQWDSIMAQVRRATPEPSDTAAHDPQGTQEREREYPGNPNALFAQALWDAAMGHSVVQAVRRGGGDLVIHMAGSFHVEKGTGIPERIEDYRPGTAVVTVVMTKSEDTDAWSAESHEGLADFVVLTLQPSASEDPGG